MSRKTIFTRRIIENKYIGKVHSLHSRLLGPLNFLDIVSEQPHSILALDLAI